MVEQAVMAEVGSAKAMASSSKSNCTFPSNATSSVYYLYPSPLATYEEVVASPQVFGGTLEKLHAAMGTKFMIPIVGGRDLDLHRLFVEVTSRGGIAKVLQEKKWKDVTGVFSFPSSATNASFILRKYYFSLLLHYEQIYLFKAKHWSPETTDQLQNTSKATAVPRGSAEPVQSSGTQAAIPQAQRANSAKSSPEAPSAGSPVYGVIDGKFESGYLVTVKIGSEEFKGVLYQPPVHPTSQEQHQNSQQFQSSLVNNNSNQVSASRVARRRRRKKSEIRKRDPAHPKPNRSGYNFFFAEQHARLKPLYPGKDREISRMIGESWNKLKEAEKAIYQEKAVRDKERYRKEMEGYRERLRTGQTSGNAVPIPQQPLEHNINVMVTDRKLQTQNANSHTLENETSSAKSEQSKLDLSIGPAFTDVIPVQVRPLQPDVNRMDLDNKLQTQDANSSHAPMNEASFTKSEKSNLIPSTGQAIADAIPVQQQTFAPDVNMTDLDMNRQTEDASSPNTPDNEMSSSDSENSNLDPSTGQTVSDAIPVQQQPLEPDVNMKDQDKKLQTEGTASRHASENDASSAKSEKSNLNPSTGQTISDAIPMQPQPLDRDVNVIDPDKKLQSENLNSLSNENDATSNKREKSYLDVNTDINLMDQDNKLETECLKSPSTDENETSSNKSEKSNLDTNIRQTSDDTARVQQKPRERVSMMDQDKKLETENPNSPSSAENETSSIEIEKSNLDANTGQISSYIIPVQQKPLELDINMMDQDEKHHENDASPNKSDKSNLVDDKTLEKDAEIEVSGGAETGLVDNNAEEILDEEEAFELRKRKDRDTDEDQECAIDIAVEGKKQRVRGEEREVVLSEAEDLLPRQ